MARSANVEAKDALRSFSEAGPARMRHHALRLFNSDAYDLNHRYVGYTEDLRQRLIDHNNGKNLSTAARKPWKLITYCAFSSKRQALAFEKYLKSGSGHAFANKRLWPDDDSIL